MKKLFIGVAVSLLTTTTFAQDYNEDAEKYSKTITASELKDHLKIIASDEFEGRETGKKGQKMAMNYLIEQFKSYGIKPTEESGYIQKFELIEQETKNIELTVAGKKFEVLKDFSISPKIILSKKINSELVFVGYGIEELNYSNYESLSVQGKAVFIMDGNPNKAKLTGKWSMKEKIALAKEKGASLVLYHNPKLKASLTKYEHYFSKPKLSLVDDLNEKETVVIALTTEVSKKITAEAGVKWKKALKKGINPQKTDALALNLVIDKPTKKLTSENVLAYIPGKENPEELVVLTAHYDHIGKEGDVVFNGADDDGSGTVAMIELAQAFQQAAKEGNGPKRSVLIMPVSGEEKGLLGSKYYTNHPVFPLEHTVANLNVDMIGRYDENHEVGDDYIYLIGSDKLSSTLHEVSEQVNSIYTKLELDYTFNDENDPNRFYYRSDHYNFAKNNIPVIFYFNGVHADYHKATDTVEKIDFKKIEKVTRLVFLTAWEIANRDERIEVDK